MMRKTRRVVLMSFAMAGWPSSARGAAKHQYLVYIGTYTRDKSQGIYVYRFEPATGHVESLGLAAETANPSFLAVHQNGRLLYAVSEMYGSEGRTQGAVSAFTIDRSTGRLTLLNQVTSRGGGPCHLVVDKAGKNVLVANYGGGSVAAMPVKADGSLSEASAFIQHQGKGADPKRQSGPHAHSINLSADNRYAMVADLGLDQILYYRFDTAHGTLAPNEPPFAKLQPGAGPRHFAFHPNGRFAYVINEIASTVTAFAYHRPGGSLKQLQSISTLPEGFSGSNSTAEVQVHPSGRFLYGSNRGHDSIAAFSVDPRNGTLKTIGHFPTQGRTPRNFGIDPTGSHLFAANQATGNIVLFRIDPKTGRLEATGQVLETPLPVCVKFVRVR